VHTDSSQQRLLQPGLWAAVQAGRERHRVAANSVRLFEINAGDEICVVDVEGASEAVLACLSADGRSALSSIGARASSDGNSNRLAELIQKNAGAAGKSTRGLQDSLQKRGVDFDRLESMQLFGRESPAGSSSRFSASDHACLLIASAGQHMLLDDISSARILPASDLVVWIQRAEKDQSDSAPTLPDPLADPRMDLRIEKRTAQSFEVRAGEFIQIIDVEGRECSDFQAFDVAKLERGIERPLDMTVTRTMVGSAYPGPGLAAKYFDADLDPLVEVIQDTVGRHDTFGLACTARYYEDMGYFGHPNCSDNFSAALEPFGVHRRAGWEAVNLFYNTGVDDHNALYLDEPWSRPGDYVLVRALTDLLCVTSACPDDTSAANGWNPTDIHVRVYPRDKTFSRAIDFRMKHPA